MAQGCAPAIFISLVAFTLLMTAPITRQELLNGYQPANVDSPEVKEMAAYAARLISQIESKSNSPRTLVLFKIISAATEVLGGTNYKLTLELISDNPEEKAGPIGCEVVVWDQPWTKLRELTEFKCSSRSRKQRNHQRQGIPIDGYHTTKVDTQEVKEDQPNRYQATKVNSPQVEEMAAFAVKAVEAKTNDGPVQLIKIVSASKLVLVGTSYKLLLQLQAGSNESPVTCDVIVFEPLSSGKSIPTLSESSCDPVYNQDSAKIDNPEVRDVNNQGTSKADAPEVQEENHPADDDDGNHPATIEDVEVQETILVLKSPGETGFKEILPDGYRSVKVDDPQVEAMAQFATEAISTKINEPLHLINIVSAFRKVSAGMQYYLTLILDSAETSLTCNLIVFNPLPHLKQSPTLSYERCAPITTMDE